ECHDAVVEMTRKGGHPNIRFAQQCLDLILRSSRAQRNGNLHCACQPTCHKRHRLAQPNMLAIPLHLPHAQPRFRTTRPGSPCLWRSSHYMPCTSEDSPTRMQAYLSSDNEQAWRGDTSHT